MLKIDAYLTGLIAEQKGIRPEDVLRHIYKEWWRIKTDKDIPRSYSVLYQHGNGRYTMIPPGYILLPEGLIKIPTEEDTGALLDKMIEGHKKQKRGLRSFFRL